MGKLIIHQPLGMDSTVVDLEWFPERIEWEGKTIYNRGLTVKVFDMTANALLAQKYMDEHPEQFNNFDQKVNEG